MEYTLYDDLMNKKYFIVSALKNGLPSLDMYNQWVCDDILKLYLDLDDSDGILRSGVYGLISGMTDTIFYIGKTNRPILLRVIDHIFETIPNIGDSRDKKNIDKIMLTKVCLLNDSRIKVCVLSGDPEDEEDIIFLHNKDGRPKYDKLTNIQFNSDKTTYTDILYNYFYDEVCLKIYDGYSVERLKDELTSIMSFYKKRGMFNVALAIAKAYRISVTDAKNCGAMP